jgi:hypothetical protein
MPSEDKTKQSLLELNKEFYLNYNVKYFTSKVSFLLVLLSDTDYLSKKYCEGVQLGSLKATGEELSKEEKIHLEKLLKTEISLIYYHSIETLFRLFIAHTYQTKCPWIEISNLTSYSKFKKQVEKINKKEFPTNKDILSNVLTSVFFGTAPGKKSNISDDDWEKNLKNLEAWTILFSKDLLGNEDYNAYKHGLGIFSTELGIELENTPIKRSKTEAISYITQKKDVDKIEYFKSYKFLDWEKKVALIFIMSKMMENIILIGKYRFIDKKNGLKLNLFNGFSMADLWKEGFTTNEIKISLPIIKIIQDL